MRLSILFSVILAFGVMNVQAQLSAVPKNVRADNVIQQLSYMNPSDMVFGIPMPEKQLLGDVYLSTKWNPGSMAIYGTEKLVEGFPLRLDLLKNELEVRTRSGVKVIDGRKIESFVWMDSLIRIPQYFVNAKDYKTSKGAPLMGFFQVIVDGKMPLFRYTEAYIKKSNYNAALDVGTRDDQIIKKAHFYYASEKSASEIPAARKKFLAIFKDKSQQVDAFMKTNQLQPGNDDHLVRIFEYYNKL